MEGRITSVVKRQAIPENLKRRVLTEAGYRCAIPTCKQTPVEIAHIIPWRTVQEHSFENLIALCPTCHTRYDKGEIHRQSIQQYKANLGILNSRYSDFERRVLEVFAAKANEDRLWLPGGLDIMLMYLLKDGLLVDTGQNSGVILSGMPSQKLYSLTRKGRQFVNEWLKGENLE